MYQMTLFIKKVMFKKNIETYSSCTTNYLLIFDAF